MRRNDIRNIVIIAHVDHGKTTLVDALLRQSGQFRDSQLQGDCILDSNDLERERGITILAKNIAIPNEGVKINIIDTPGHADVGGEVERVVRMADGAVLLIDAAEGPLPQTRYVLSKALECGVRPIVVINKIDRSDARPHQVLDEAFELIMDLDREGRVHDFPHLFACGRQGYATADETVARRASEGEAITGDMRPLLDMILKEIPGPDVHPEDPLQLLVTTLDWSEYVGRIAIGRVQSGVIRQGQNVALMKDGLIEPAKVAKLFVFHNLGRVQVEEGTAGDIVAVVGLEDVEIGDTIADPETPRALPRLTVDEPTVEMVFTINSSPLAGRDGKYVTTRQIRERLNRELQRNVALRVRDGETAEKFLVSGRGVLHLAILIETMRREGYELAIGKPKVILHQRNGRKEEPWESLVVEVPTEKLGPVMEMVGARRGELKHMEQHGEYTYVTFSIPARGLIGLRTPLLNATQGTAVIHHRFEGYQPLTGDVPSRSNGVLVSMISGRAVAYGLNNLQERSVLFVAPGDDVYEGMIVGENSRDNDMPVNPCKEKKLTNVRASGSDENIILKPPREMTLEVALEYIAEDELVEVTPKKIRLRKVILRESERRKRERQLVG